MKPLKNRFAFVTGASRGIGRSASIALAQSGAHVIALARSTEKLISLRQEIEDLGENCTFFALDLLDYESINLINKKLEENFQKIDIFFGNAGLLGEITSLVHTSEESWFKTFQVNLHANFLLLKILDPFLRLSDAGRVIFMTSGAAYKCNPLWGTYSVSKAALEALAKTYASETLDTSIKTMLLSPGPLRTAMRAEAVPGENPMILKTPEDLAPHIVKLASPSWQKSGKIYDFASGGTVRKIGSF